MAKDFLKYWTHGFEGLNDDLRVVMSEYIKDAWPKGIHAWFTNVNINGKHCMQTLTEELRVSNEWHMKMLVNESINESIDADIEK